MPRAASASRDTNGPRIIAAKTPPIAALTTTSWTSSAARRRSATAAPCERTEEPASLTRRLAAPAISRPAPRSTTPPTGDQADRHDGEKTRSAARRGASQAGSTTTGEDTERGRQRAVGDPGQDAEPDAHSGREPQVAGRGGGPAAKQDDRRERPRASPVSTVQLTNARFWPICVAGTARV